MYRQTWIYVLLSVDSDQEIQSMSATLDCMLKKNLPLDTKTFVELNWFGEKTARQLEGEDRIEVQEFREAVRKLRRKK
jgi:hypothetical protein